MTTDTSPDALARGTLALEYERAGDTDMAAAFRAGAWTCHDHPAYRAVLTAYASRVSTPAGEVERRIPPGYTAETWAAKQAETAEFSRRDPLQDQSGDRLANSEARLRAAYVIQCADVPDQFALVRRADIGPVLHALTRHRAGHELAIARRESAPIANAGERESNDLVTLADCPPGPFLFNDTLGFKTEYGSMETVGPTNVPGSQIRWTVGNGPDVYVMMSGEKFWGGASTKEERDGLLVRPIAPKTVEAWAAAPPQDAAERELFAENAKNPSSFNDAAERMREAALDVALTTAPGMDAAYARASLWGYNQAREQIAARIAALPLPSPAVPADVEGRLAAALKREAVLRDALDKLFVQALQSDVNDRANEYGCEAIALARAALAIPGDSA